jgi:hypothetical protein
MYHLDPVVDAERAIDRMDAEAREARDRDEAVAEESKRLASVMFNALTNGPADLQIPTPGSAMRSWPLSHMFFYLADEHASTVFDIFLAASNGEDVQKRAQDFQRLISNSYGEMYADSSLGAL